MKIWLVITALSWNGVLVTERVEVQTMEACKTRGAAHVSDVNKRGSSKAMYACWKNNA